MLRKICVIIASMSIASVCLAQPKVVGHRGCRDVEGQFENTVSSLEYAQKAGVDAVEFDVQLASRLRQEHTSTKSRRTCQYAKQLSS